MSERIITVSNSLWLIVDDVHPAYDDGLFTIRDNSGGNALVARTEIPALIEALGQVEPPKEDALEEVREQVE